MTASGGWAWRGPARGCGRRRHVVERRGRCGRRSSATVIDDGGAPGTSAPVAARPSPRRRRRRRSLIAPLGHACTQAGASPAASRPWHMSHLRTMPRRWLKTGHLVGARERAVAAADALVVEVDDDAGDRVLLVGVDRAAVQAAGSTQWWQAAVTVCWNGLGRRCRRCSSVTDAPRLAVVEAVEAVAARRRTPCSPCRRRGRPRTRTAGPARAGSAGSGRGSSAPARGTQRRPRGAGRSARPR